jgi:NADH dehydrogenase FAD-containing subunit
MNSRAPVLVIGAGPAGLAVSACLKANEVEADFVDAHGVAGGAYARMYPRITLSSPAAYLSLPGTPIRSITAGVSAAEYQAYLRSYAVRHSLAVERRRVVRIDRADGEFIVEFDDEPARLAYKTVVVATGMCDHPVFPDIVGLPEVPADRADKAAAPEVLRAQDWQGPGESAGRRVLVVGGGMRAVEIAEECADAGLQPVVSVRGALARPLPRSLFGLDLRYLAFPVLRRLPLGLTRRECLGGWRFRGIDRGFNEHVARGNISVKPGIARVDERSVHFADRSRLPVDVIVFATGYRFEMRFLPKEIPRSTQGYPLLEHGQCKGWPGLFVLGVPCALRADSHFIHGIAADAPVIARQIACRLTGCGRRRYTERSWPTERPAVSSSSPCSSGA